MILGDHMPNFYIIPAGNGVEMEYDLYTDQQTLLITNLSGASAGAVIILLNDALERGFQNAKQAFDSPELIVLEGFLDGMISRAFILGFLHKITRTLPDLLNGVRIINE